MEPLGNCHPTLGVSTPVRGGVAIALAGMDRLYNRYALTPTTPNNHSIPFEVSRVLRKGANR